MISIDYIHCLRPRFVENILTHLLNSTSVNVVIPKKDEEADRLTDDVKGCQLPNTRILTVNMRFCRGNYRQFLLDLWQQYHQSSAPEGPDLLTILSELEQAKQQFIIVLNHLDAMSADDSAVLKESIIGNESLFIATDDSQPDIQVSQPTITRLRYVDINPLALSQESETKLVYTEKVILNLFPDVSYIAINTSINYRTAKHYVWIGKIEGLEFGDVTLVVKNGQVTGDINANGTVYRIRPMKNSHHAIQQIDASAFPQYEPISSLQPKLTEHDSMTSRQRRYTRKDDGSTIDVMVVYTPSAANASGDIESEIELAVEETNQAYANSDIQQRLKLVHTAQVDYIETGDFKEDLNRLFEKNDGYIDDIHQLRNMYRADLVSFWVERNGGKSCGYGYIIANNNTTLESYGFSVVARDCATAPRYSFGHELGHNMGASHDIYTGDTSGVFDYSYGYVHITGDPLSSWRTIMAYPSKCYDNGYDCNRIQHFSNPRILYNENATGNELADNYSTLNNTAATIAAFRQSFTQLTEETQDFAIYNEGNADLVVSSMSIEGNVPWISISPTNATISPGNSVSVEVHVNYLAAPLGENTYRLLINSNDPDETPQSLNIIVNRQPETAGDEQELKDAEFVAGTNELFLTVEVPNAVGETEVYSVILNLVDPTLIFQINHINLVQERPPGDIASYDPQTMTVHIPVINVPDAQGRPQLYEVTMQLVPSNIPDVLRFQVTEATPIEVPIVE